jgi:3-hydroxyacyl-[acyl-carrier-protein] dehydratase
MQNLISELPHREPFVFLSEIVGDSPNGFQALWRVDGGEDWLRGHFPTRPVVPGVLIIEALGQCCGVSLLARQTGIQRSGMLAQADVRFRAPVAPPAVLTLTSQVDREFGELIRFQVSAQCEGRTVAEGALVLALTAL